MKKLLTLITVAAICGGSVPVFAKVALEVFHPFTLVMVRFFFASLVLIPFMVKANELSSKLFKRLFWVAVVGALNPIILFIALPFTQASVSPLIYAAIPAMTAVYLAVFRKQKISLQQVWGIAVGFVGVALIILLPVLHLYSSPQAFSGNLLIFLAVLAFFVYALLSKDIQEKHQITPLSLTFYFSFITFLLAIPFSLYEFMHYGSVLPHLEVKHILSSIEIGVIGTSIFYICYQQALKVGSEVGAALFTYLQPVATIGLAIVFLGEKLTWPFACGGILAVIGAQIASGKKISLQSLFSSK